jgi:hypothetical protein
MHIASIGIDFGKTTFHLVALRERNKVLIRKKFSRAHLLAYTANLPSSLIGLEACAGAHFMGTASGSVHIRRESFPPHNKNRGSASPIVRCWQQLSIWSSESQTFNLLIER